MDTILVTGHAGFIGSNLVKRLFRELDGGTVVGVDNLNDYYDPSLKEYRLRELENARPAGIRYVSVRGSIADKALIDRLFDEYDFDVVVNLAAQAGVRYSIENPDVYVESNIIGFYNILEACRHSRDAAPGRTGESRHGVRHLVYASSSSVYGGNKKVPFSTDDRVDNPVSLYAATKKSNELFAHCYSKLYGIPTTGLRFFTVYGPAGRPDMAYFGFTDKLLRGETIKIFNYGRCRRDFTYVDDIVEGVWRVMQRAPGSVAPCVGAPEGSPLRETPLGVGDASLRPLPSSSSSSPCDNSLPAGPSPCPCPGVDTLPEGTPSGAGSGVGSGASDGAGVPYAIYNIGGGQPENLLDFVQILQEELVRAGVLPEDYDFEAHKELVPMQPGDVPTTFADSSALERDFGFVPRITLREGLRKFAQWYKEFYG